MPNGFAFVEAVDSVPPPLHPHGDHHNLLHVVSNAGYLHVKSSQGKDCGSPVLQGWATIVEDYCAPAEMSRTGELWLAVGA